MPADYLTRELAKELRRRANGKYDGVDDETLVAAVKQKRPDIMGDVMKTVQAVPPPTAAELLTGKPESALKRSPLGESLAPMAHPQGAGDLLQLALPTGESLARDAWPMAKEFVGTMKRGYDTAPSAYRVPGSMLRAFIDQAFPATKASKAEADVVLGRGGASTPTGTSTPAPPGRDLYDLYKKKPANTATPEGAGATSAAPGGKGPQPSGSVAPVAASPAPAVSSASSGQPPAVPKPFQTGDAVAEQSRAEAFDRVANRNGMAQNVTGQTPGSTPSPKVKLSAQDLAAKSRELAGSTPRAEAPFKTTTATPEGNKQFSEQVKRMAPDVGGKAGQRPLTVAAADAINPKLSAEEQYAGIKRVADYAKANPWLRPADLVTGQEARKRLLKALDAYYAKTP